MKKYKVKVKIKELAETRILKTNDTDVIRSFINGNISSINITNCPTISIKIELNKNK